MNVIVDNGAISARQVKVNTSEFDNNLSDELKNAQQVYDFIDELALGDGGTGTGTDSFHIHNQISPSNIWTINHSLNKRPSVTVVDSAKTVVYGLVEYISNSQVVVKFTAAFGGVAYLN